MVRASLTLLAGTKDARLSVTVEGVAGERGGGVLMGRGEFCRPVGRNRLMSSYFRSRKCGGGISLHDQKENTLRVMYSSVTFLLPFWKQGKCVRMLIRPHARLEEVRPQGILR